jgi:DNA-binding transcriptional regulator YiaG
MVEEAGHSRREDRTVATVDVKRGQAEVLGTTPPTRPPRARRASAALPKLVREEYGLSRALFARLLGVSAATLARWEKTGKLPNGAQDKVGQVADLLRGLGRVMPRAELAGWLTRRNEACRSAGGRTPADLMAKRRYDKIAAMIYFFESGVAY